jgi:D-serine deaminase-like pyridoxal phosphate-dependent protein
MKLSIPTLLINEEIVGRNLSAMLHKAEESGAIFRPHFKTHQSEAIGEMFRKRGVNKITVSSVSMAKFFADRGWDDITIAFPLNLLEMDAINQLASRIRLNLLLESVRVAERLVQVLRYPVGVFVKIDTGYHRTGLLPEETDEIDALLKVFASSERTNFKGFLTHAGHTYHARSSSEILTIKENAANKMLRLKRKYQSQYPDLLISYGDTPSCSLADNCSEFDEIRPGNFVYYDVMQYHLGSCRLEDIAVVAACPVVAVHPQREEVVIYGGAVHLSKEFIAADHDFRLYGYVVKLDDKGHWGKPVPGAYVFSLPQEHGLVKIPRIHLNEIAEGDVLGIMPVHSCLTAHLIQLQMMV